MGQNTKCLERLTVDLLGAPKDINSSAIAAEYFSFSKLGRAMIAIFMGDGTASSGDIVITLTQATVAAGTDAKVLNITATGRRYSKIAADYATYAALTTQWTEETETVTAGVWTHTTSGEQCGVLTWDILPGDLDVDGGFCYVGVAVSAASSAKVIAAAVIGLDPANQSGVTGMANPLV